VVATSGPGGYTGGAVDSDLLEHVAASFQALTGPVSATTLGALLRTSGRRTTRAQLEEVLDDLVRNGDIHRHPPHTGRVHASPRYFARSPAEHVKALLLEASAAKLEWAESTLGQKVPKAYRDLVDPVLESLLVDRQLFERRRRGRRYIFTHRPPTPAEIADRVIEQLESAGEALARTQLRGRLSKADRPWFDDAVQLLVQRERVFQVKVGRSTRLTVVRPCPTDSLTERQRTSLWTILEHVNAHRRRALEFDALLAFLNDIQQEEAEATPDSELSDDVLIGFYHDDVGRRGGLRTVPILWTWERYRTWAKARGASPDHDRFLELFHQMTTRGKVALTPYDNPRELTDEQVATLGGERGGRVDYYWAVY